LIPVILTGLLLICGVCSPDSDGEIAPAAAHSLGQPTGIDDLAQPGAVHATTNPTLPRTFTFSTPLFAPDSAWNQTVTQAAVSATSDEQILVTYRVLRGDTTSLHPTGQPPPTTWPFPYVNYDDYTIPVFRAGAGEQSVLICDYDHQPSWPSPKFPDDQQEGGPVTVPAPAGVVRPAGPQNTDADGHLVLYDPGTFIEYDFWQATTVRNAECDSLGGGLMGTAILEAGAIDFFDVRGSGANIDTYSSARATGPPLLAGLIMPEDIESGAIEHALAVAIPGLRNLSEDPYAPLPSDYFYPASTTETDFYNTNPNALAAGQRICLKAGIVDETCNSIDENSLAPITRMFLAALRTYGAILVDNAGGFTFYAEDIHTADLDLSDAQVQALIGQPSLPAGKTKWQIVIEALNLELEQIPFACGPENPDPAQATVDVSNFEVVTLLYLIAAPPSRAIDPGGVATYTISVRSSGGSTANVSLVTTSPSPSLTLQLVPSSVSPLGQATLTITDRHTDPALLPGQWYVVPITATDGVTQTASVSLLVGGTRIYLPAVLKNY